MRRSTLRAGSSSHYQNGPDPFLRSPMPELPEVEVTRRALAPAVERRTVLATEVREHRLRWPVADLSVLLGRRVERLARRGKYLLWEFAHGTLMSHLGMSGAWRVWPHGGAPPPRAHDHVDLAFEEHLIRLTDPRRFGALLWHPAAAGPVTQHPLLAQLGIEPFDVRFDGAVVYAGTRGRTASIKQVLLAGQVVVGVGNIYASEALFRAGIHPATRAVTLGPDALRTPCACRSRGSERRDQRGREYLARFLLDGRRRGLFHAGRRSLRAGRGAVPPLWHARAPTGAGTARELLLPVLPATLTARQWALVHRFAPDVGAFSCHGHGTRRRGPVID